MQLSVLIINYKVPGLAIECLRSLNEERPRLGDCEVFLVENASGDGSDVQLARAIEANGWSDWVHLTVTSENFGFAGGNNLALREESHSGRRAPYVLLLNPDTIVTPGSIQTLVEFLDSHPEAGIAGSRLEFPAGGEQGTPFRFQGLQSELERGLRLGPVTRILRGANVCWPKAAVPIEVDWVAGASMLIRREVLEQVGPLDEGYFSYFEDMDYCLQARQAGWSTWYVPDSLVLHWEGKSSGVSSNTPRALPAFWFAARRRYFLKNHGLLMAILIDTAFLMAAALGDFQLRLRGKASRNSRSLFLDTLPHSIFFHFTEAKTGIAGLAAHGALWATIGFGLSQLLRFIANLAVTRLLVPEFFGVMAVGNTVFAGLTLLTDAGLNASALREPSEDRNFFNTLWTVQVVRGALIAILCAALSLPFATLYHEPQLKVVMPVLGLGAFLAGLSSTYLYILSRRLQLRSLVIFELTSQLVGLVAMVGWAWYTRSIEALIAGSLIPHAVRSVLSWAYGGGDRLAWNPVIISRLLSFGRWILLSSSLLFLSGQIDRLLLGKLISLQGLGVYGIALTISELPRVLILSLSSSVLLPVFSKLKHLPRSEFRDRVLRMRMPVLVCVSILLCLLAGFGDWIIRFLFDPRYAEASWMLPLLAIGLWPATLVLTLEPALQAIGRPVFSALANGAKFVFTCIAILMGFAWFGVFGAVAAVALNDVPYYCTIQYGLRRESLGVMRQDLIATLCLCTLFAAIVMVRRALGVPLL